MTDMWKVLEHVKSSNNFFVSDKKPKFIGDCEWLNVNDLEVIADGKYVLNNEDKNKLKNLLPLELPVTTDTFFCPIEKKNISIGLHYYDVNGWILNSAALHYIVNHSIVLPEDLIAEIKNSG
jgi:hypothetical protein